MQTLVCMSHSRAQRGMNKQVWHNYRPNKTTTNARRRAQRQLNIDFAFAHLVQEQRLKSHKFSGLEHRIHLSLFATRSFVIILIRLYIMSALHSIPPCSTVHFSYLSKLPKTRVPICSSHPPCPAQHRRYICWNTHELSSGNRTILAFPYLDPTIQPRTNRNVPRPSKIDGIIAAK